MALDKTAVQLFREVLRDSMDDTLAREGVRSALAINGHSEPTWRAARDGGWLDILRPGPADGEGPGLEEFASVIVEGGARLYGEPLIEHGAAMFALAKCAPERADAIEIIAQTRIVIADPAAIAEPLTTERAGEIDATLRAVRFAAAAEHLLLVYDRKTEGPEVALVNARRPEIKTRILDSFDPYSGYGEIRIASLRPTGDEIIASGDTAVAFVADLRTAARLLTACELSGMAARTLDMSAAYAGRRHQFGKPIGSFQAIQQILADMVVGSRSLTTMCDRSLERASRRPEDRDRVSRVLKAYAATASRAVVEASLQVHGGIAFTREFVLGSYYTHVLALEGHYGDGHTLAAELGAELVNGDLSAL